LKTVINLDANCNEGKQAVERLKQCKERLAESNNNNNANENENSPVSTTINNNNSHESNQ